MSNQEIRENFPFLLWASGLAAFFVISLTVVAFYFNKVQRDADDVQLRSSAIIPVIDSISHQLQPRSPLAKTDLHLFERLRVLSANDDLTLQLAEKIYRRAAKYDIRSGDELLVDLGKLHGIAVRTAMEETRKAQAQRTRLQIIMFILAGLTLIVISFFTGISLGELKNRYKAYRKEKELNKLKSHFISVASHEFRTPLSSIQLCVSLIDKYTEKGDKENILKQGRKIRATIANLTAILEDFLSLEKLETGKITPSIQKFDLTVLCEEVLEEVKMIAAPGQQLTYEAQGVEEMVHLDKSLLRNSMLNLLSNAVKYAGEAAQIRLHSNITVYGASITVSDNGKGVPKDQQKNLFTPFFRADPNTSVPGTGLGLSIVKKYTELMNGFVSFSSVPGQETSFELNFPIQF